MRKTIRTLLRSGLLAGALFALSATTYAQYTVSLTANPGTTGNGPMGSSNYHASEHIYLASEIGTDLNITQIGFSMNALTGLPKTYNSVSIYLQTTANTTFVSGLYSTAGYTLVYNGPITFPSAIGFTDVTLTTPFNYTLAAGNLQMLVVRTDNVTAAGPVMNSANGNSTLATASTCRRYNGTGVPTIGVTTLAITAFRAAVKFSSSAGTCPAFPANFSQTAFHCYQLTPS